MFNPTPRLLSADLKGKNLKRKGKQRGEKKIKERKLRDEETRKQFEVKVQQRNNINRGGWKQLSENVLEVAKEVCGETTGHRRIQRATWWWNEAVQSAVQEKKRAYTIWQRTWNEEVKVKWGAYAVAARSCGAHLRLISPWSLWWVRTRYPGTQGCYDIRDFHSLPSPGFPRYPFIDQPERNG